MPRLFLLGDSTCAIKTASARPETGWGEVFWKYLKPGWILDNRAINGRSTREILENGEFNKALEDAVSGDAVIIQFGHNDEKVKEGRGADAWHAYRVNLIYMAEEFRKKGVRAIFMTSIARRRF